MGEVQIAAINSREADTSDNRPDISFLLAQTPCTSSGDSFASEQMKDVTLQPYLLMTGMQI